jgi:hypothetical protein
MTYQMTCQEKAQELVSTYRLVLMNEDTECGQEILCTTIAIKCAIIAVDEILKSNPCSEGSDRAFDFRWVDDTIYWEQVKQELIKQQEYEKDF